MITDVEELLPAMVYEYAKSHRPVRSAWDRWMQTPIEVDGQILTVCDIFRRDYPSGIASWPQDKEGDLIMAAVPKTLRELNLEPSSHF